MKPFYIVAGTLALLLGILGLFLPLLPTTPFLLLASWCFARGSARLHRWLLSHGVFGEYLRNFEAGRGIPLKAKIVATLMLWTSLLVGMQRFYATGSLAIPAVLALTGACVSLYLWRFLPTLRLERAAER